MIISSTKYCVTALNSLKWQVFQKRFSELEVFPVYHNNRSYSEVCTQITRENLDKPCFMIFEDDACPTTEDYLQYISEIEKQILEIDFHWDVLYLGCHLLSSDGEFATNNILKNIKPYCTHCVLYKSSSYETLLNLVSDNPLVRPHCWDEMVENSNLVKIAVTPMAITQLEFEFNFGRNLLIHDIMQNSHKNLHLRLELNEKKTS